MFKKNLSLIFAMSALLSFNCQIKAMQDPTQNTQENVTTDLEVSSNVRKILAYLNSLKIRGINITNLDQLIENLNHLTKPAQLLCITIAQINNHCALLQQAAKYLPGNFSEVNLKNYQNLLYKIFDKYYDSTLCLILTLHMLFKEIIAIYQKEDAPKDLSFLQELTETPAVANCSYQKPTQISQFSNQTYKSSLITLDDVILMLTALTNTDTAQSTSSSKSNLFEPICTKILSYIFEHYYIFKSDCLAHLCLLLSKANILPPLNTIINNNNNQTLLMCLISLPNCINLRPLVYILDKEIRLIKGKTINESLISSQGKITNEELKAKLYEIQKYYWHNLFTITDHHNQTILHLAAAKLLPSDHTNQDTKIIFEKIFLCAILSFKLLEALYVKDINNLTPFKILQKFGYPINEVLNQLCNQTN